MGLRKHFSYIKAHTFSTRSENPGGQGRSLGQPHIPQGAQHSVCWLTDWVKQWAGGVNSKDNCCEGSLLIPAVLDLFSVSQAFSCPFSQQVRLTFVFGLLCCRNKSRHYLSASFHPGLSSQRAQCRIHTSQTSFLPMFHIFAAINSFGKEPLPCLKNSLYNAKMPECKNIHYSFLNSKQLGKVNAHVLGKLQNKDGPFTSWHLMQPL